MRKIALAVELHRLIGNNDETGAACRVPPSVRPHRQAPTLVGAAENAGESLGSRSGDGFEIPGFLRRTENGLCSVNPELPPQSQEPNYKWLQRELRDLRGAMDRLEKWMAEHEDEFDIWEAGHKP